MVQKSMTEILESRAPINRSRANLEFEKKITVGQVLLTGDKITTVFRAGWSDHPFGDILFQALILFSSILPADVADINRTMEIK